MATLTVGAGKRYATIAAAIAASRDGDTVSIAAGVYTDDFATIRNKITVIAVPGQVILNTSRPMSGSPALLTVSADATIDGLVFAGAQSGSGVASGILYTGGALTIRNSLFTANQSALTAQASANGTITIQASEFAGNGGNDGFTPAISVGAIKTLTITNSFLHDALLGAELRSRAGMTVITGTRIEDLAGTATTSIDLPNGGVVQVQGNTIQKGANASGPVIQFGGDSLKAGLSLSISGNTVVSDKAGVVLLRNQTSVTASLTNNTFYGFTSPLIASGPAALSSNFTASTRPETPSEPLITPAIVLPTEFGRAGAVTANGTVLTVGPQGTYRTVSAAIAQARDNDTIRIAAGFYNEPTITVTHSLILEGMGGLATFKPTYGLATAQFVTAASVTFRNIEITGVMSLGGVAAAILDRGGSLTLVNSFIHDNQSGIVATASAGPLAIYDSELARNGTPDGRGNNLDIGAIGTAVLRNAYVHDAIGGPEIRSIAANTVIDGTRISQAAGNGAADLLLQDTGRVSITNSAIEKGTFAKPTPLVQVGAATPIIGSDVSISGTTFINDNPSALIFVANAGTAAVALTNNVFAGTPGSTFVQNGSNTGATTRADIAVATAAPWNVSGTPLAVPLTVPKKVPVADRGILALRISGDAYHGEARFNLFVDGIQVSGDLTATASHAAGETQPFTIAGSFTRDPHSVTVRFINDLNSDTTSSGRALYVDAMSFNGVPFGAPATLADNASRSFLTGALTTLTPVTINVSEDSWHGDVQAFIAIDGKVLGGLQTVTAHHGLGQSQSLRFLTELSPGNHIASVTALNATGPRALYVDSIDIAGQQYPVAGNVATGHPLTTAFVVAPPVAANTDLFLSAGLPEVFTLGR